MPTNSGRAGISSSTTRSIGPAGRSALAVGTDRGVDGVVDGEDLGQAGDLEHLQNPALGADQRQVAVMAEDPLEPTDEDAEPGRVEELDALEVDQDRALTLVDQLDELLAELRCGVDVDFSLYRQDGPAVAFLDVKPKIHVRSLRALQSPGEPTPARSAVLVDDVLRLVDDL